MFTFACTGERLTSGLGPMEGQAEEAEANPGTGRSQVAGALTQEARMPIVQMKSLSPGEAQAALPQRPMEARGASCCGEPG